MSDQRNIILAAALSFLVIVLWQAFLAPEPPEPTVAPETAVEGPMTPGAAPEPGAAPPSVAGAAPALDRETALAEAPRIPVSTPSVKGSISLRGARVDDLKLEDYKVTLEPGAPDVTLLSPFGTLSPYYAVWGWTPARGQDAGPTPQADTLWALESGETLAPGSPVTVVWDNGEGLVFRRTFSIDDDYMFTVTQSVENRTGEAVTLAPYGIVARHGTPETINFYILHEGAVAEFDGTLHEYEYGDMLELAADPGEGGPAERFTVAQNGWLGFTDKYWMTALAAGPGQPFTGVFKAAATAGGDIFQTDLRLPAMTVAPGETAESVSYLFAGAKEVAVLEQYEERLGIAGFIDAIDWGWFFFLTKPISWLLLTINSVIGNIGWSIIVLTVIVKAALFPLAYKSYVSMSKMKQLQPEMEKIKERVGDDRMKMQQEMIALYKKEKVNPASGCLPILLQIPIFFSLYKVIFVSIELRHAPWIGWIQDLSAPDPSTWMNLFGLLPFDSGDIPGILALFSIGVLPILMGVSMWMQQKLNPAPTDPVQQQIFALMPWLFMFMLGQFASGLVLYWIANNVITFIQQYTIMRSQGVDVNFLGNVKRSFRRRRPAE